jgi:cytochrome c oxidase subunit 3
MNPASPVSTMPGAPPAAAKLGLWMFLATVAMLFAALASAYLIRMAGSDWRPVELPPVLWWNTAALLASSAALEIARARRDSASRWTSAAMGLGLVFLAGQGLAWSQLVDNGVLLPTSPHASFLYLLSGLHGLHLFVGLLLLASTLRVLSRAAVAKGTRRLELTSHYWHFMGGLWVFLFAVLHLS